MTERVPVLGCMASCSSHCWFKRQFVSVMIFPPRGSRFPRGKSHSRWREFSFALHQIQSAIEPHLSLRQTLLTWNEIARALAEPPRCRLPQCFDSRIALAAQLEPAESLFSRSPSENCFLKAAS